jgi:hypothetical protein
LANEFPSPELKLNDALACCDMTTTPTGQVVDVRDRLSEIADRYGPHDVITRFIRIYILFDEWSEVDKDPQVQPYLAEMLRRTTSAVPGMYLKLACIPGRTHLATPITEQVKNPIGLEEGDDISADVNLDELVFAKESVAELAPFFMAMIKKHVEEKIEWVRHSSAWNFQQFLTTMIFSDPRTFVELCQASGGVPRDFMSIYRNATIDASNRSKSSRDREPFTLPVVRMAAKKVYDGKRESFAGKSSSPQLALLGKESRNRGRHRR